MIKIIFVNMKKILFFAIATMVSLSAAAQAKVSKTIISEFDSREIVESFDAYYGMATSEPGYIDCTYDEAGNKNGFVSVTSHYDRELHKQCVKVRVVNGHKMLVISYFGKIGQDGAGDLAKYGCSVATTDTQVVFRTATGAALTLRAEAAAEGVVELEGTTDFTQVTK